MVINRNIKNELIESFTNKEYEKVKFEILNHLKTIPHDIFLLKLLGMTYLNLKSPDKAINAYKKAIDLAPKDAEVNNNYGFVLSKQGNYKKAEFYFKNAIKFKNDYLQAKINLIDLYTKNKRYQDAEKLLRLTISQNLNSLNLHYNLALILNKLGKFDEAIDIYKKLISLKPNSPIFFNNLGNLNKLKGNIQDALTNYNKAIKLNPNIPETYNNLANIQVMLGKLNEAVTNYSKAIKLNPNFIKAHTNLGKAFIKKGEHKEAKHIYLNTLKIDKNCLEAQHMINALNGNKETSISNEYVKNLFNDYANTFDKSLIEDLNYSGPELLKKTILNHTSNNSLGKVLDLGCGTGLMGQKIIDYCEYLEGVDISDLMLKKAKTRKIYNKLINKDIITYLEKDVLNFDYFIFADVFVYIGDLNKIFDLIKRRNISSGKLLFTTEHNFSEDYKLETTGRFSHSKNYIENLSEKFGYELCYFNKAIIRKEDTKDVNGAIYLLKF